MSALLPVRPGRIDDTLFMEEFKGKISQELEELLTNPETNLYENPQAIIDKFASATQLPMNDKFVNGMVVRCCQDVGLTVDETTEIVFRWALPC